MLLIVLLCAIAAMAVDATVEDPLRPAMEQAIARVTPALVRIQVVWVDYAQGREVKNEASGSGFIITKDGYLVTNHHVAGRAKRAVCVFANNEEIEATLIGTDPLTDIAVLKLNPSGQREFPTVTWGDSAAVAVGDTVLALGSPLALSQSVTRGIVSNAKMILPSRFRRAGGFTLEGEDVGALVRWIAHDAPIYPGNSGGPLVDLHGRVIGVNEISLGLSGAIPANLARTVAEQIMADGYVRRSWLGLETQPLLKSAGRSRGVLISGVVKDSPAEQAGFQSGDILLQLAGHDISVRFDEELPLLNQLVAALPIGQEINAVVERAGRLHHLTVRTAERERVELRQHELKPWGCTVRNISFFAAKELKLDRRDGALVTSVRPGGPSSDAKPPLQPNDVLRVVAGQTITNVAQLIALTDKLTRGSKSPVPVAVQFDRKSEQYLTVIKVGLQELDDPGVEARKAWLPIAVQPLTPELVGTNRLTGVRITQVYTNRYPAAAVLQAGDWITELDGEPIPVSQPGEEETFFSRLRQYRIGATPELLIRRADHTLTVRVELVRSPLLEREMKRYQNNDFEFTARDLSFFDRVQDRLPDDLPGALVTEVKSGGWAALGGLQAGDIVQAVDDQPIGDVLALEKQMHTLTERQPKCVTLRVLRGIHTRYLELEPNWEQSPAPEPKGTP